MPTDSIDCNVFDYSIHFIFCAFGVFTNALNVVVFLNPKLKDPSFRYLLIISISDFFYCGLSTFYFANYCNAYYLNRYYQTNYFYIIRRYLICVCAFFNLLIEIFLGFDRYMLLLNRRFLNNNSIRWLLPILLIISILIYSPYLIVYDVIPYKTQNMTNITYFKTTKSAIGKALLGQALVISINVVRAILILIVLTTINILVANEFKKRYNLKKQNIKLVASTSNETSQNKETNKPINEKKQSRSKGKMSITKMVFFISILQIVGTTPIQIQYCLTFVTTLSDLVDAIVNGFAFLQHSSNIFVYFFYNNIFRQVLISYFKKFLFIS